MFKIAICDDDLKYIEIITEIIKRISARESYDFEFESFSSADAFLENEIYLNFSCAFIDIEMPCMSGFELARELQKKHEKMHIVFISNKNHLVFESFRYHPFSFVRKSHLEDEMKVVLKDICIKIIPDLQANNWKMIETTRGMEKIDFNQVVYIESQKNYSFLYFEKRSISSRISMRNLEKELSKFGFVRTHSGYLINMKYIEKINVSSIDLFGNKNVPLSRNKKQEVLRRIKERIHND